MNRNPGFLSLLLLILAGARTFVDGYRPDGDGPSDWALTPDWDPATSRSACRVTPLYLDSIGSLYSGTSWELCPWECPGGGQWIRGNKTIGAFYGVDAPTIENCHKFDNKIAAEQEMYEVNFTITSRTLSMPDNGRHNGSCGWRPPFGAMPKAADPRC